MDWEKASLADAMRDLGPLLWWYVPPGRWEEFFHTYGAPLGDAVAARLYWWAARTSLAVAHGLLERGDRNCARDFVRDFIAAVARGQNPHAWYVRSNRTGERGHRE